MYKTGISNVYVVLIEDGEEFLDNKKLQISEYSDDTIYEAENAAACNGVGEAAAAAVEMTRLCPNGLSPPNKGGGNGGLAGSFRYECFHDIHT